MNAADEQAIASLTLRDHFAAAALQGFLANGSQRAIAHEVETSPLAAQVNDTEALRAIVNAQVALGCYRLADAMLAERAK